MTAGLPAGRKLIVDLIFEKQPRPRGREEREQGDYQRPDGARGVVTVDGLKRFCLALRERVIQACGARVARSQAAQGRQGPSGWPSGWERTA
jgi:hypothetical protein